jgi:class 3 adenylate cyclase
MQSEDFGHSFRMGVGLHSGPVMSGNVGSEQRMEYTAIGDTTNTASRLESMTKTSGVMVLISETTRSRLHDGGEELVPLGRVEIRGRNEGMLVWSISEPETPAGETPVAAEPSPAPEANAPEKASGDGDADGASLELPAAEEPHLAAEQEPRR